MKRSRLLLLCIMVAVACLFGARYLRPHHRVPTFTTPPGALVAFTEYTLDNGLTVILAPNRNSTAVAVCVTYDAGSRYDPPGRAGLAHLCEHLMFKGSANVAAGEHADLVEEVGGTYNAYTNKECTRYFETLPPNQLPLALFLEADRMRGLAVTDNHVEQVRAEVLAEKGLDHDDIAYDSAEAACERLAYSEYGYQHRAAGTTPCIDAITTSDVRTFLSNYYAPNRAALCITGNFDPAAARQLITRNFDSIPRGSDPADPTEGERGITEFTKATVFDRIGLYDSYTRAYSMPAETDPDYAAIAVLADLLANGDRSPLHQEIVENCGAVDVASEFSPHRHTSLFTITVKYAVNLDIIKARIDGVLADIAQNGVTPEELERSRASLKMNALDNDVNLPALARNLSKDAVCDHDANRTNEEIAALDHVTVADIKRVTAKYLVYNHMCEVVSGFDMKNSMPDPDAAQPTTVWQRLNELLTGRRSHSATVAVDATPEAPKGKAPVAPTQVIRMPAVTEYRLANGLTVEVREDHSIPTVHVELRVGAGIADESKAATAMMTSQALVAGSRNHPWPRFVDDLADRGIRLEGGDYADYSAFSAESRSNDAPYLLASLADVVEHPAFDADDFRRIRAEQSLSCTETERGARSVFYNVEYRALGGSTPYSRPWANAADIGAVQLSDILGFYGTYYKPNRSVLLIAGDFDAKEMRAEIAAQFGSWTPGRPIGARPTPPVAIGRAFVVNWRYNTSVLFNVFCRAPACSDQDRAAFEVMDEILASSASSRLYHRVRERMAKVYESNSTIIDYPTWSFWKYSTSCSVDDCSSLYKVVHEEIKRISTEPVSQDELDRAKRSLLGYSALEWDQPEYVTSAAGRYVMDGLPPDYPERWARAEQKVTAADVLRVARTYLTDDRLSVIGIGPAADVGPALGQFGPVDALDDKGRPIANTGGLF